MGIQYVWWALLAPTVADTVIRDQPINEGEPRRLREDAFVVDISPKVEPRLRDHGDWNKGAVPLVLQHVLLDPSAVCCLLLIVAYAGHGYLFPPPKAVAAEPSPASSAARKSRAPDRFALVVNQKLTRLDSADEVMDFLLSSMATGRTDIVNVVTAIHRSAKLVAGKSSLERVRVGQDARMHEMIAALDTYLKAGGHSPAIMSRAVGNTSWALAKLQYRADQSSCIVDTLHEVFVKYAASFRPEEMMNTVWAFAELRREKDSKTEAQTMAVAQAACKCLDKFPQFTVQQVVYFSWALARLSAINSIKHDHAEVRAGLLDFTQRIVARSRPAIRALDTKNLAMLSWAVASLYSNLGLVSSEVDVGTLMAEIAALIQDRGLKGFLPGEIASFLWAVNKVRADVPQLYRSIAQFLLMQGKDLRRYSSQDIATILCAFVKTGYGSDALYSALAAQAASRSKDFNRSEKMMVQWAFSQLPHLAAPHML